MENFTISLVCLFCNIELKDDISKEYKSGSLIHCHNCGEDNDYDSVIEEAKEKVIKNVKNEFDKSLKNIFKGLR